MPKRTMIKFAMPFLQASLVKQILVALIFGVGCAYLLPEFAVSSAFLGTLFISALKAVAPLLVFVLVTSAIANHDVETKAHIKPVISLYIIGTFGAALVAVTVSYFIPTQIMLVTTESQVAAPGGVMEVMRNMLLSIFDNPVNALLKGNYIGILAWATGLGVALRHAADSSRQFMLSLIHI